MKKIFFGIIMMALVLVGCDPGTGDLTGVQGRRLFYPTVPYGMVYVPNGSYTMGQSDEDVPFLHQSRSKVVSIFAFYIDNTEITNNEYREFVYYVKDSIVLEKIYENATNLNVDGLVVQEEISDEALGDMLSHGDVYYDESSAEWKVWDDEFDPTDPYFRENFALSWETKGINGFQALPLISDLYLKPNERWNRRKEIDVRQLNYKYYWVDLRQAAARGEVNIKRNGYKRESGGSQGDPTNKSLSPQHRELNTPSTNFVGEPVGLDEDLGWFNTKGENNAIRGHSDRGRFIIEEQIRVYPDTLCWIRDFTYSFNDPMVNMYFWHIAYDNYPVVGVTWKQARAFSHWRTQKLNNWLGKQGMTWVQDFRLPTEAEWEYASRGDLKQSPYPWGGPYIRNSNGCMLANFKPLRGRYVDDGGFYPVKAYSYNPNGYGLYCMAGNVAEWTETAFDESVYEFSNDMNSDYRYYALDWDPPTLKRKVIRGGSWKDIGYYLQNGTRTYEFQDTTKSYIGFRCVQTHIGRGGKDIDEEGGEGLKSDIEL
ncbi:MAG: SUMF1/EgtB/PvdO family nonheme iron enzyme [Crocinitomicaceae bacterium]